MPDSFIVKSLYTSTMRRNFSWISLLSLPLGDIDSIHYYRSVQFPLTKHRCVFIISIVQPDPLKIVLSTDEVILKRHFRLFSRMCFIVGNTIGSGILISYKDVLRETQSVGLCLIIWVACSLVSSLGMFYNIFHV
ncbi:unnamed protein product [Rotaria sp. Silwood1]|nr:unnamed protein product [Rotaria sp. Silwood1]